MPDFDAFQVFTLGAALGIATGLRLGYAVGWLLSRPLPRPWRAVWRYLAPGTVLRDVRRCWTTGRWTS